MKPILLATHKRLEELERTGICEWATLFNGSDPERTRPYNARCFEIDVAARDPQIQPKLMGYVRKRRYELENPTPTQPEADPDYLLVDGY